MKPQSKTKSKKKLKAEEFDTLADSGKSLEEHIDWGRAVKIINVSLPVWMVKGLDDEAKRLNIDRQAVIKTWLAERLDDKRTKRETA